MVDITTQSPNASVVKSVGQRLKDSCRGKEFGTNAAAMQNGSSANHAAGKGAKQQNAADRTLRMHHPIILNDLQKNTVRIIGQVYFLCREQYNNLKSLVFTRIGHEVGSYCPNIIWDLKIIVTRSTHWWRRVVAALRIHWP